MSTPSSSFVCLPSSPPTQAQRKSWLPRWLSKKNEKPQDSSLGQPKNRLWSAIFSRRQWQLSDNFIQFIYAAAFATDFGSVLQKMIEPWTKAFVYPKEVHDTVDPRKLAEPDSRFCHLHGIRVHFKTYGFHAARSTPDVPTFVLLHGLGGCTFSWREVVHQLAQFGRVIAFDRPPFGLSQRPLPNEKFNAGALYSLDGSCDLTVSLMDKLGVKNAVLVGNSAGGCIAAATTLRHPQRVSGLVLVAPAILPQDHHGRHELFNRLQQAYFNLVLRTPIVGLNYIRRSTFPLRTDDAEFAKEAQKNYLDPAKVTSEVLEGYRKPLHTDNWDVGLLQLYLAPLDDFFNVFSHLPRIRVPTLVIAGDQDQVIPLSCSVNVHKRIAGSKLAVLPKCGHLPHEEFPSTFTDLVREFCVEHAMIPGCAEAAVLSACA
mmetsp:Transcript_15611/g.26912  ORF Transcript_15611/g.26912 Transcript_15611/m.26912 type:complete len:429 (-) Transcript_15611:26-1312(-)